MDRDMEEANKLVGAGKKFLVTGKVVEAVSSLQEACGMLAKKYGDTADECGEAFFWCGKALLDLARMENSVLGNALEGVPEGDDEDKPMDSEVESTDNVDEKTRDELRDQVYDAMAEKRSEDKQSTDVEKDGGDAQKEGAEKEDDAEKKSDVSGSRSDENETVCEKEADDNTDELQEDDGDTEEDKEEDGDDAEGRGEGDAAGKESDEEEEVGNLQLAWEMLEVAKVIYTRKDAAEDQLMAAQAHLKLGEVSAESGNYSQAVEDFQECLKLQLKYLDSDSRLLAETSYQLALTFSLNLQYEESIEQLHRSIAVIKNRLGNLTKLIEKASGPEDLLDERKEMEELTALLPEIQEKVEDATEGLKALRRGSEAGKGALDGTSAFPGCSGHNSDPSSTSTTNSTSTSPGSAKVHAPTAAVSDISHLVRKKRKQEESPVKEGSIKKVKQDGALTNGLQGPHTNGEHKTNGEANGVHKGDANGHATKMEVEGQ